MRALAFAQAGALSPTSAIASCILFCIRAKRRYRSGQRQKLLHMFTVLLETTKLKFKVGKQTKTKKKQNKTKRGQDEERKRKANLKSHVIQAEAQRTVMDCIAVN